MPRSAAGFHAPGVAGDGIDLAVVAQRAERLGALHVGAVFVLKRWWNTTKGARHRRGEVDVELAQMGGGDEALVDDRAERAARDVGLGDGPREPPPQAVGGTLVVVRRGGFEDGLQEQRAGRGRLRADERIVGRRRAPLDDVDLLERGFGFERSADVGVAAHEQRRDTVSRAEDGLGDGEEHARAVGRAGVSRDRAAVHDAGQPVQRRLYDHARRAALRISDESDAAGVAFHAAEHEGSRGSSSETGTLPH